MWPSALSAHLCEPPTLTATYLGASGLSGSVGGTSGRDSGIDERVAALLSSVAAVPEAEAEVGSSLPAPESGSDARAAVVVDGALAPVSAVVGDASAPEDVPVEALAHAVKPVATASTTRPMHHRTRRRSDHAQDEVLSASWTMWLRV